MDRFKFRGKRVDNGEWGVGLLIKQPNLKMSAFDYIRRSKDISCVLCIQVSKISCGVEVVEEFAIIPKTIGQCTGLKDCKGKLIFEGDTFKKDGNIFKIEWYDGGFVFAKISDKNYCNILTPDSISRFDIIIIGNIHEVNK